MGKTFVEDERPCDSCVNVTRYGCVSWNCEYINRDEAIKAWREKHEMADRKTENSSEIPNNCEPQTDDDKKHCVFCRWVYEPNVCGRCRNMNLFADAIKDEPQTNKDFKVTYTCSFTECKNFGFNEKCIECKRKQSEAKYKDEPQKKEVEWVYNKRERLWYPYSNGELLFKDEPQTERSNDAE